MSKATKIDLFRESSFIVGQEYRYRIHIKPSTNQLSNLTQQDIQKLNASLFRTMRLIFLKTTQEQRNKRAVNNLNGQIEKVKTYIEEDSIKHTNTIGRLQKLKRKLNETQSIQLEGNIEIRNSTIFEQNFDSQEEIQSK